MNAGAIPAVLGESSFQAFLHPPGIGNCFVFEEDGASDVDDVRWLSEKRQKACTSLRSSSTTRMALFTSATPRRYSFRNGQDRLDALACSFSANCVVSRTRPKHYGQNINLSQFSRQLRRSFQHLQKNI